MANQDEQSFVLFEKNDGPYESAFAAERMIAMATAGPGSEDSAAEKKRISWNLRYQNVSMKERYSCSLFERILFHLRIVACPSCFPGLNSVGRHLYGRVLTIKRQTIVGTRWAWTGSSAAIYSDAFWCLSDKQREKAKIESA